MTEEPILLQVRDGGVCTLTLNRPHRKNAVTLALWGALRDALTDIAHDPGVRAVVLTGAGNAFCSGADVVDSDPYAAPFTKLRAISDVAQQLHDLPVPTVAKVRGVAVGAGWNLALGCDMVVATPDATFSQVFARRGLSLDCGGSWLLPKLVGMQQAKRLALLADTIDAAEARELGLVTWIESADVIDDRVDSIAARLAAGPPIATAQTKALLNENSDRTMREALANESRAQAVNFATTDVPEAYAAFSQKRPTAFTGDWNIHRPES
ncbi:enoyl-CoA hydratase/isomerase family protein [Nocardia bovistercoris]|uniref:Enoyl-CoA hydratase/isomerase family protein n=1 Tax=Nocardia bovistercoris TaxID=2785916 RepID=A0A931N476_9NOCA|nr:enoyl-CoA hydratase-related protein [Nocardia bovistercoris]MBH0777966.1 enoyl-CoA hydratase/isomerase family protein [Nocardia bovistercoris]